MQKVVNETEKYIFPSNFGVLNPYALAEQMLGKKINWKQIENVPNFFEKIFQTPYQELFDPKFKGPLFPNVELDSKNNLKKVDLKKLLSNYEKKQGNDVDEPYSFSVNKIEDLVKFLRVSDMNQIQIEQINSSKNGYLSVLIKEPEYLRIQRFTNIISEAVLKNIANISLIPKDDWTPENGSWGLNGRFFNETAEFFDPIQGAVANCYFIAALSAVAWAYPFKIQHLTRATGVNQDQFNNLIRFYKPDSNGQIDKEIEVSSTVPLNSAGNFIYARSSEREEIWPAIYEKAFAKFKTGVKHDHPNILETAWGDCVYATALLTGGSRFYYDTASRTGDDLWTIVRGNSRSYRTFNPMTAWTYSSADASEKKIIYDGINIVASHCYTVLGWEYRNNVKYIILRNPWGSTEASQNVLNGNVSLYDISWWRPINLSDADGTFALEANAFQKYFAGIGVVR